MNKIGAWLKDNIDYGRNLVGSGLEGASTIPFGAYGEDVFGSGLTLGSAAAIGAGVGAVTGYLSDDRRRNRGMVVGALIGTAVGLGGCMAWRARHLAGAVAQGAMKNVSAERDARWLRKNPVDFG